MYHKQLLLYFSVSCDQSHQIFYSTGTSGSTDVQQFYDCEKYVYR